MFTWCSSGKTLSALYWLICKVEIWEQVFIMGISSHWLFIARVIICMCLSSCEKMLIKSSHTLIYFNTKFKWFQELIPNFKLKWHSVKTKIQMICLGLKSFIPQKTFLINIWNKNDSMSYLYRGKEYFELLSLT